MSTYPAYARTLHSCISFFGSSPRVLGGTRRLHDGAFSFYGLISVLNNLPSANSNMPVGIACRSSYRLGHCLNIAGRRHRLLGTAGNIRLVRVRSYSGYYNFNNSCSIGFPRVSTPVLRRGVGGVITSNTSIITISYPNYLLRVHNNLSTHNLGGVRIGRATRVIIRGHRGG